MMPETAIPFVLVAALFFSLGWVRGASSRSDGRKQEVDFDRAALDYARYRSLELRTVLNRSERALYDSVKLAIDRAFGVGSFPVLCQVPLAAFVETPFLTRTTRALRAKRPDFIIVDYAFKPIIIVEYQGPGHEGGLSDEIKREVSRRLGISLIEVLPDEGSSGAIDRILDELRQFRSLGGTAYREINRI